MAMPTQKEPKKHWYGTKRHLLGWVAFLVVASVIAAQLTYSMDKVLPMVRVGSDHVGGRTFNDTVAMLNREFESAKLTLYVAEDKSVTYPLRDAGAQLNTEELRSTLTNYPLWQRLIPFSSIVKQPVVDEFPVYFSDRALTNFATARAKELSIPAQNAGLAIKDGEVVATADTPGLVVQPDDLITQIKQQTYYSETEVFAPRKKVAAEKTIEYFSGVKQQAEQVLAQTITINIDGKEFTPSQKVIASWLELAESEDQPVELAIRQSALDEYLDELQKETREKAGTTRITVVNGKETKRVTGESGREIDTNDLHQAIESALFDAPVMTIQARFITLEPTIIINNKYTSSEAGLRAFVSDKTNTNSVQIAIEQLDGGEWSAYGRADESRVSASTYKLFVALRVYEDIDAKKISWSDSMLDTTVRECFHRMLVVSLNTCAEAWLGTYTNKGINDFIWKKGFSRGTDFNNPIANHTTARDLTMFMRKAYNGLLLSTQNRAHLLDSLSGHGYTKGIPSGSAGKVYNKVGFLWDYSNDTAIVQHPKGTYVIAVLTKGKSFYAIADIVREAERIMYPD